MPWRPLLDGSDADRARAAIDRISDELVALEDLDDPTLIRGWAGIALFHGYRARCGDPDAAGHAHDAIAAALGLLGTGQHAPWFGDGYLGIAWVMEHLRDVIDVDDATLLGFDVIAGELLSRDEWKHEYELWDGLIGLGVHAFERRRLADVARVVWHLDRLAERTPDGAAWRNRGPVDFHNLGTAHGAAGVLAFLARACTAGIAARPLLADATRWLLAQERRDRRPRFGFYVETSDTDPPPQNGWCYGDASTATAFVAAGTALEDRALIAYGRELALDMARGPLDDVLNLPAGFCHGTAGRAHLFSRLAAVLGDDDLRDAARRHARATLERMPRDQPPWDLRSGSAGIGLVLLGAVEATDPAWDRLFLIGS
jgi:lantibiotic modifying enzyme